MKDLNLFQDSEIIPNGSIIILYEVGRLDVMKGFSDIKKKEKKQEDYYEYMLVDCSVIQDDTFCLINVTRGNPNCGSILCMFEGLDENEFVTALKLKKYFGNKTTVFVKQNRW